MIGMLARRTKKVGLGGRFFATKLSSASRYLIYAFVTLQFVLPLLAQFFSHSLMYVFDVLLVLIVVFLILDKKLNLGSTVAVFIPIFLYCLLGVCNGVINGVSILVQMWALRNYLRFPIFFLCCYNLLGFSDYVKIKKILYFFAFVNIVVSIIEMFSGVSWDDFGGIFGYEKGANGYLLAFLSLMLIVSLDDMLKKRIPNWAFVCLTVTSIGQIALAELKFGFFLLPVLALLILAFNGFKLKYFVCLVFLVLAIYVGIMFFGSRYDGIDLLSPEYYVRYFAGASKGYNSINDVNRTTFVSILDSFCGSGIVEKLFGYGLGYGEVSNVSFLCSKFGYLYSDLLHYNWFLSSFTYLECGFVGIILYLMYPALTIVEAIRRRRSNCFSAIVFGVAVMFAVLFFYNASMRDTSGGFFAALVFSMIYPRKENYSVGGTI